MTRMNAVTNRDEMVLEAVTKGKEVYRAAFEMSGEAQSIISPDLNILRANHEFCRVTGYHETELTGLNVRGLLDPADTPVACPTEGELSVIDVRFIHKNGAVRKGRFRHRLIEDDIELPFCMLMTLEDVTDSAVPAEAARMYDRLYRYVIDESTDSIAFLDRDGQVLFMNGAGLAGLGASPGALSVHCHYAELWNGIHGLAARAAVKLASNGSTARFEAINAEHEAPRWWEVRIVPIQDGDEGVTMLVAVSREITALRKEEDLRRELEKRLTSETAPDASNARGTCIAESVINHDRSRTD
jgi:PAS domain S-box-containing protein